MNRMLTRRRAAEFWDPGVVKIGFLANFHAGLTYFHIFPQIFENRDF